MTVAHTDEDAATEWLDALRTGGDHRALPTAGDHRLVGNAREHPSAGSSPSRNSVDGTMTALASGVSGARRRGRPLGGCRGCTDPRRRRAAHPGRRQSPAEVRPNWRKDSRSIPDSGINRLWGFGALIVPARADGAVTGSRITPRLRIRFSLSSGIEAPRVIRVGWTGLALRPTGGSRRWLRSDRQHSMLRLPTIRGSLPSR